MTNNVEAIKIYGADIGNNSTFLNVGKEWEDIGINSKLATINNVRRVYHIMDTTRKKTRDNLLGYIFIKQCYNIIYGNLIQGLEHKYARVQVNSIPESMDAAYKILLDYKEYLYNRKKIYHDIETGLY